MDRRNFLAQCGLAGTSLVLGCGAADLAGPKMPGCSAADLGGAKRFFMGGGTVTVLRNQSFATRIDFGPVAGYDVEGCFFAGGYTGMGGPWSNWNTNVVAGGIVIGMGNMFDTVFLGTSAFNQHFLTPATALSDLVFDGMIFERLGVDPVGDSFILPPASNPPMRHWTLRRSIVLPNSVGNDSGTVVSQLGAAYTAVSVINCTALMGTGGGVGGGETYSGYPGIYRLISRNIFYDVTARGYAMRDHSSGAIATDLVLQPGLGPNVLWNAATGRSGPGIDWPLSYQPTPFLVADPQFRDPSVSLRTWDQSLGGAGTDAGGLAGLLNQDPGYTPAALIAFYRNGMIPTNPACFGFGAVTSKQLPPPPPPPPPPPDCVNTSTVARTTAIGRPRCLL